MPLPESAELFFGLHLTDEQKVYTDAIFDKRMVFINAKSGTGKTTVAVGCARIMYDLDRSHLRPLYYIFSPVEEKKMGFRKGDQEGKEDAYLTPLRDALVAIGESPEHAIQQDTGYRSSTAWVIAKSHVFLRGTNIMNSTVIIAEAQNWERGELKKVLTRLHDSNHVIVEGHDGQCDLPKGSTSGFVPYLEWFKDEPYVQVCQLTKNFRGEMAQKADDFTW